MGPGTDAVHQLWRDRHSEQLKYSITERLAQLPRQYPDLFQKGLYIPITASGRYRKNVLSFIRRLNHHWLLVVVPMLIGSRMAGRRKKLAHIHWGTTRIKLPDHAPRQWRNVFTGEIKETISQF